MTTRGIRGATTADGNDANSIYEATKELLVAMQQANSFGAQDLAAALFTVTPDLTAAFPARAARMLGWTTVPLMDSCEIPVEGSLAHCIRVLLLWNTDKAQTEIKHSYLKEAATLRPDLKEVKE